MTQSLRQLTWVQIAALAGLLPTAYVVWRLIDHWWVLVVILFIPALLLGFYYRAKISAGWRVVYGGLMLMIILVFTGYNARIAWQNIHNPPAFDFRLFWTDASVAVRGGNFYVASEGLQTAKILGQPDDLGPEYAQEVQFFYPPQSMLLFAPLGWFDIHIAFVFWYILQTIVLAIAVMLLWKTFFEGSGSIGLLFTVVLIVLLRATTSVISYGQTNFLVLLLIILLMRDHSQVRRGLWFVMAAVIKLLMAALLLYPLLRKRWRTLTSAAGALVAISILTIIFFGSQTQFYVTQNPDSTLPSYLYSEISNQSLLATILRTTGYDFSHSSPLRNPVYLVVSAVLTIISCWLVYRRDKVSDELAIGLLVSLALLIYPVTGDNYSLLLIISLMWVWSKSLNAQNETTRTIFVLSAVAFITLEYGLISLWGNGVFVAIALNWLVLVGVSIRTITLRPAMPARAVAPLSPELTSEAAAHG